MSTRRAKQLIYGAFYVLVLLIVVAGFYFVFIYPFRPAPPVLCTPSSCAPASTAQIVPGNVSTFVTSPGHYTFLAQVTNQNANYGAQVLNYEIDLDSASGIVLQSTTAQSFIYQSQSKYLAVLNQTVAQPFDHATLVIDGAAWTASSTLGAIPSIAPGQFAVQNVQTATASTTVSVGAQLVNTTVTTFGQVLVMVIFDDAYGNPIGVSQTELSGIAAGATTNFSVLYPVEPNIDPAQNQILVYAIR